MSEKHDHEHKLEDCHDCGAKPGEIHSPNCDVVRCSVCGGQRLQCDCPGHDPFFARWTGIWPGKAEADYLDIDLNEFDVKFRDIFFRKPVDTAEVARLSNIQKLFEARLKNEDLSPIEIQNVLREWSKIEDMKKRLKGE